MAHVLTELPHHTDQHTAGIISNIVSATVNTNHSRGCDWRKALFLVTKALEDVVECSVRTRRAIRLLAEVATLLYARANKRTVKGVLHLSLCLWKHFCLIQQIIEQPKSLSVGALYRGYLHDLLHSPLQMMVVSPSSTCTEVLERLQGQTRRIAEATTSRRPNEIVPTVLLRMQAETENKLTSSLLDTESQLRKLAAKLQPLQNTIVDIKQLTSAGDKENFRALMRMISPYLKRGPGVWWAIEDGLIIFRDGSEEPDFRPEGPPLRHLRSSTLQDAQL